MATRNQTKQGIEKYLFLNYFDQCLLKAEFVFDKGCADNERTRLVTVLNKKLPNYSLAQECSYCLETQDWGDFDTLMGCKKCYLKKFGEKNVS